MIMLLYGTFSLRDPAHTLGFPEPQPETIAALLRLLLLLLLLHLLLLLLLHGWWLVL